MTFAVDITDGRSLSNESTSDKEEQSNAVFAVHYTVKGVY